MIRLLTKEDLRCTAGGLQCTCFTLDNKGGYGYTNYIEITPTDCAIVCCNGAAFKSWTFSNCNGKVSNNCDDQPKEHHGQTFDDVIKVLYPKL